MDPQELPSKTIRALGLMSGSSLDGLDVAYCEYSIQTGSGFPSLSSWKMGESATLAYSAEWAERLQNAPALSGLALTQLHSDYGDLVGNVVHQFMLKYFFHH